jgi:hypothetical protein
MNFWSKLFSKEKQDKEIVIAVATADNLKLFKSIDDAILYLQKSDNKKSIQELEKLKKKIAGDKKVKAVKITEENEIIEYENLEELKKNQIN